uniref:Uncharacterized protein n=1 Tax=Meloidogyne floridensis TaxID=298350 RepID=A0A915NGJ2_9BILA
MSCQKNFCGYFLIMDFDLIDDLELPHIHEDLHQGEENVEQYEIKKILTKFKLKCSCGEEKSKFYILWVRQIFATEQNFIQDKKNKNENIINKLNDLNFESPVKTTLKDAINNELSCTINTEEDLFKFQQGLGQADALVESFKEFIGEEDNNDVVKISKRKNKGKVCFFKL